MKSFTMNSFYSFAFLAVLSDAQLRLTPPRRLRADPFTRFVPSESAPSASNSNIRSYEQAVKTLPLSMPIKESDPSLYSPEEEDVDFGQLLALASLSMEDLPSMSLSMSMSGYTAGSIRRPKGSKSKKRCWRGSKSNKASSEVESPSHLAYQVAWHQAGLPCPPINTTMPSEQPSVRTSSQPSSLTSSQPSSRTSSQPSSQQSYQPSAQISSQPSFQMSSQPSSQSSSQPFPLQGKLVADDGAAGDWFGYSVAIRGETAIVGAYGDDDNGIFSGSAYVFVRNAADNWIQEAKLIASDGAEYDQFGESVGIYDNTAIVGARFDGDNGSGSGSVYVFARDAIGNWNQQDKLLPNDGAAQDYFGRSVAIYSDTAIVGADGDDDNGINSGSAYVFVRNATDNWSQQAKLVASDGAAYDTFGWSVAIYSDTAIVGALEDGDNGSSSGSAYVFVRNATGDWTQEAKLVASDGAVNDWFGISVSIHGDTAIVGASGVGEGDRGAAYVFVRNTTDNSWTQQEKLTGSDTPENGWFGKSVGIDEDSIIVGAPGPFDGGYEEYAYLFLRNSAGGWTQQDKFSTNGETREDLFGDSVGISNNTVIVGAFMDADNGLNSGAVYILDVTGGPPTNTTMPSEQPSVQSSSKPSSLASPQPFSLISSQPSSQHSNQPSEQSSSQPSSQLSSKPSSLASDQPSSLISSEPSSQQSNQPSEQISSQPSSQLSSKPSSLASDQPSSLISSEPSSQQSNQPSEQISSQPSSQLSSSEPSSQLSNQPSVQISSQPSFQISIQPSSQSSHQPFTRQEKLLADDGAAVDRFGGSVGIYDNTAIVGARNDDDNGCESGSAYIMMRNATGNWNQQAKLVASDGAVNDYLGTSVSIHGDTAIVGADGDDDNGMNIGSAYAFVRNATGSWIQEAKLVASDGAPYDWFGTSVSIHGDTAIVGANLDDDNGRDSGSAYAFVRNATGSWIQEAKLVASDGALGDRFGYSVSIHDDTAIVGVSATYDDNGSRIGSAYAFVRNATGDWAQQAKLVASDGALGDRFGYSVSIHGDTAIVGAPYVDYPSEPYLGDGDDRGAVYVFVRNVTDNSWTQQAKLTANDGAQYSNEEREANGWFGSSVDINNNSIIVGAPWGFHYAYLFLRNSTGDWTQQDKFSHSGGGDGFGFSVGISNNTVIVGASGGNDYYPVSGAAYIFSP